MRPMLYRKYGCDSVILFLFSLYYIVNLQHASSNHEYFKTRGCVGREDCQTPPPMVVGGIRAISREAVRRVLISRGYMTTETSAYKKVLSDL